MQAESYLNVAALCVTALRKMPNKKDESGLSLDCEDDFVISPHLFSLSDCDCDQQFFRTKPQDAEVAQGGMAVVECEVANMQGRVQWTKDGLTMGE